MLPLNSTEIPLSPELTTILDAAASGAVTLAGVALTVGVAWASRKLSTIAAAHGQAALAADITAATAVIQPALQTSASVIAGKINSGALPLGDRAAWVAEAQREAALVAQRVPGAVATLQPVAADLVADIMGKVDAAVVASPTIPAPPPAAAASVTTVATPIPVSIVGGKP